MDDLQEIKADIKQLLQQSAVHNQILSEHKAYSLALQREQAVLGERIKPIERHVVIMGWMLKIPGAIFIGVSVQYIVKKLMLLM